MNDRYFHIQTLAGSFWEVKTPSSNQFKICIIYSQNETLNKKMSVDLTVIIYAITNSRTISQKINLTLKIPSN
jgi:hypothetical protein